ncbi:MAG: glycosyl hydrolase family 28-related protein [Bryobacteraceae bacterium]
MGATVYAFTNQAIASLGGGTGTAYVYVDQNGVLTVGYNGISISCTAGCTAVSGIVAFPATAFQIATIPAAGGTWGAVTDLRASFSNGASSATANYAGSVQLPPSATSNLLSSAGSGVQSTLTLSVKQPPYNAKGDGITDDTSAIANACSDAIASQAVLFFPPGRYLTDTTTCINTYGVTFQGSGPESSTLVSRSGGNVIEINTTNTMHTVAIRDLGIDGNGGAANHGIYVHATSTVFNVQIQNVTIQNVGGRCIYMPVAFQTTIDRIQCKSTSDNGIEIQGNNSSIISNSYVHQVGANKAAYVVYSGTTTLLNDNGIDGISGANAIWGIFGQSTTDGDSSTMYSFANIIGCNIEDFTKWGIWVKAGNPTFKSDSFLAYSGTTTEALHYDGAPLGLAVLDSGTTIQTGGSWTNGYAIHGVASCPGIINYAWGATTATGLSCYNEAVPLAYANLNLTKSNPAYGISALDVNYLSASGGMWASKYVSNGTTFTATGCSISGLTGGSTVGSYISGTTGTCTVTLTLPSATHGWSCWANDQTTPADVIKQTYSGGTSARLSGTTVSGDVINFGCIGF